MPRANQRRKVELAAEAIEAVYNDISVTQIKTREDLLTLRERIDNLLETIPTSKLIPAQVRGRVR